MKMKKSSIKDKNPQNKIMLEQINRSMEIKNKENDFYIFYRFNKKNPEIYEQRH